MSSPRSNLLSKLKLNNLLQKSSAALSGLGLIFIQYHCSIICAAQICSCSNLNPFPSLQGPWFPWHYQLFFFSVGTRVTANKINTLIKLCIYNSSRDYQHLCDLCQVGRQQPEQEQEQMCHQRRRRMGQLMERFAMNRKTFIKRLNNFYATL